MLKIILTGPESSGKTTLCTKLSKLFEISIVKEYAREYLDSLNRNYSYVDILLIAKNQIKLETGIEYIRWRNPGFDPFEPDQPTLENIEKWSMSIGIYYNF